MAKLGDVISTNKDTFGKLLAFSFLLFFGAFGAFFGVTKTSLGDLFASNPKYKDVAGVVAAVLTTNIIIGLYVYSAFQETAGTQKTEAAKKRS